MAEERDQGFRRRERAVRNDNPSSERLCYFLRHHPAKDQVFAAKGQPGGWFKYEDVRPWFTNLSEAQLDALVANSRSFIPPHDNRFENKTVSGEKWIRARYGHSYDTSFADVEHDSEQDGIPTLTELLIKQVASDLPKYLPMLVDLSDGLLVSALFHKHKRLTDGKISNKVLKCFLLPQVTVLDFKGLLIEDSIIRLLPKACPSVHSLSLEGCFTCMTDTNLQFLLKRCTELRLLDISGCKYLTDTGLQTLIKLGTKLTFLSVRWIKTVSPKWVQQACRAFPNLELINITGCSFVHPKHVTELRTEFPNMIIQYDSVDDMVVNHDELDHDVAQDHFMALEQDEVLEPVVEVVIEPPVGEWI